MLENAKTRVIMGGTIIPDVSRFNISYDYKETHPTALVELRDGSKIDTRLTGIDHVKDNAFNNEGKSVSWVQYTCERIEE